MFKAGYSKCQRQVLLYLSFDLNNNQTIPMKMLNALIHN